MRSTLPVYRAIKSSLSEDMLMHKRKADMEDWLIKVSGLSLGVCHAACLKKFSVVDLLESNRHRLDSTAGSQSR